MRYTLHETLRMVIIKFIKFITATKAATEKKNMKKMKRKQHLLNIKKAMLPV